MDQIASQLINSSEAVFYSKKVMHTLHKLFVSFLIALSLIIWTKSVSADVCGNNNASATASYSLSWRSISIGTGMGASGFSQFDSDDDGYPEVLFGTGTGFGINTSFAVAEYDQSISDYVIMCQSTNYTSGIKKIVSFQNNQVSYGSLVAQGDGSIEVIDHALGIKVQLISTGITSINDIVVADIDNDGSVEIAVLSSTAIELYDANNYNYEQSLSYGGSTFTAGQFIDNIGTELALNTGYILELVGTTVTILWDYSTIGFSDSRLKSGDLDNDGLDEIVGADSWYSMRAFNADIQGILWEHTTAHNISALGIFDSTGNNTPEVIYGDSQWGALHGLDGPTGIQSWVVSNPEHGVTDVLVGNLDNDSGLELMWGAGFSTTGADYLYIHDLSTDTNEWRRGESSGPYYGVALGNIDNDGIPDRVYASFESESGYGDGLVTAIKGGTNEILWQTTPNTFGSQAWTGVHDVVIDDIDGDGINEVIVGTDKLYDGIVYILDIQNGSVKTSITLENGSPIYSVRVVDIDGDGDKEILAGGGKEHTGANGVYVYVIDGSTATWVSTLPGLGNNWSDLWTIEPVDIDNDGTMEVVALWESTYIIDPDNNGLTATASAYNSVTSSVDIFTGNNIVYIGGPTGGIHTLSADGSTNLVATVCTNEIDALETISPVMLAFTCGGRLATYDIVGGIVEWQTSASIDSLLGDQDRLVYKKISGVNTLLIGGSRAYYFIEVSPNSNQAPIAYDGNFSGHFSQTITGTLNAIDPASAPITYGIYRQPASGRVDIVNASTGEFVYTPTGDFSGVLDFEFYVSNGATASNLGVITLTLTNTIPSGATAIHDTHWSSLYLGNLSGVDGDGDSIRFEIVSAPSLGALVLLDEFTGEYSYYNTSPAVNSVSFSYRVTDGASWSSEYTVTLNLLNTDPVATSISLDTYYTVDISTFVTAADSDGDDLTYEIISMPPVGIASLSSSGLLTYAPDGNTSYSTVISYRVHDGKIWSAPGSINVNVVGLITPPFSPVYIDTFSASDYAGVAVHDVDFGLVALGGSGSYIYSWDFGDGQTAVAQSPSHTYTLPGQYKVTVLITDMSDGSNTATGYLNILVLSPPTEIQVDLSTRAGSGDARSVDFDVAILGGNAPYTVTVDFGDGETLQQSSKESTLTIPHSYTEYGTYNITVTVDTSDGISQTMLALANQQITIEKPDLNSNEVNDSGSASINLWISLLLVINLIYSRKKYK